MSRWNLIFFIVIFFTFSVGFGQGDFPVNRVVPKPGQVEYQQMELIGFIHFGVNTFTNREWGTGREDPAIFDPDSLDPRQWARVAREAGMKQLIITAKHHDGFCLWPSGYTDHSVEKSPWKNGKGDVLRELSEACKTEGIKLGVYLSPWDMAEPSYGTKNYNRYYLSQLEELLTSYGTISEVWMDGAKGENAKDMVYDFEAYRALIYRLQPGALIFSDAGPDIRWIGNEKGIAGETNWSTIHNENIEIGKANTSYLNRGDPGGTHWLAGECDVSIRPGWFYHPEEDNKVKSPGELVDLYYKSVGRNGTLLLNIPPDRHGRWHVNDIKSLLEFRSILDETFARNLADRATVTSSGTWGGSDLYHPSLIQDGMDSTFWAADKNSKEPWVEFSLGEAQTFNRIMLQEPIRLGQRISAFRVEILADGQWKLLAESTTIGYKRLLRVNPVTTDRIRIVIEGFNNIPALSNFGLYLSSDREPDIIN